jgi:heme exporter protein D
MLYQNFLHQVFQPRLRVDQSDLIQDMARYMNERGSSFEVNSLLLFFIGMLAVVLVLKVIYSIKQAKEERLRLEAKKKREEARKMQAQKPNHKTFRSVHKRR